MAPPSKLTPEVQDRICQLVRVGNTIDIAANAVGVTTHTFERWLRTRKGFHLAVEGARAEAEAILVGRVQKAAQAGSWRAACWLLERQWPERWAPANERNRVGEDLDRELDRILAKK